MHRDVDRRTVLFRCLFLFPIALLLVSCAAQPAAVGYAPPARPKLKAMRYAVQVGAFSRLENAVRLEARLQKQGVDAYYFMHDSGLYKVRFGNYGSYRQARAEAEGLKGKGIIEAFFIILPEQFAAAKVAREGRGDLRADLVQTARRFLGVPYRWGGTSAREGFDCSGLAMVVYRLNGLDLPRTSFNQYREGDFVKKPQLRQGDLVFFATNGGRKVSHVGLYIGDGKFIHAPRKGKSVCVESLSRPFYQRCYLGARTYL